MKTFFFYKELCDMCKKCEIACVEACKNGSELTRKAAPFIHIVFGIDGPNHIQCRHCEEPPCVDACIGVSLYKGNYIVGQSEERCIGCLMCNMVCPYGVPQPVYEMEKMAKCCFQCGEIDNPPCVKACDRGALKLSFPQIELKKIRRQRVEKFIRR